jgi:BA14K-like protein
MSKPIILGAAALSLALAVATPALAQHVRGGGGGVRAVHAGGANFGGVRAGAPTSVAAQTNFRGAQASVRGVNIARQGAYFAGRSGVPIASTGFRGGYDRGWGRGAGFVAGLAAGSALAYGANGGYYDPNGYYGSSGYDDPNYYGNDYAYNDGEYDPGYPVVVGQNVGGDASYCAQRYRSYDPASGTYLGYDGLRHPCP